MSDAPRFVVRRFNWRWAGTCFVRAPGDHRVAWFDTRDAADADAWRRETEVRGRVNPFACGPAFHYLSTLPEPIYLDWLRDADVIPPEPAADGKRQWPAWWDATRPTLSESQEFRVWEGLNRVRFFDVIARRPSQVAYAVVRIVWEYNDYFYEPGDEGGKTVRAFRTRERAEAHRATLEATDWPRVQGATFENWRDESNWPHGPNEEGSRPTGTLQEDVTLFEVVEIDIGEETS